MRQRQDGGVKPSTLVGIAGLRFKVGGPTDAHGLASGRLCRAPETARLRQQELAGAGRDLAPDGLDVAGREGRHVKVVCGGDGRSGVRQAAHAVLPTPAELFQSPPPPLLTCFLRVQRAVLALQQRFQKARLHIEGPCCSSTAEQEGGQELGWQRAMKGMRCRLKEGSQTAQVHSLPHTTAGLHAEPGMARQPPANICAARAARLARLGSSGQAPALPGQQTHRTAPFGCRARSAARCSRCVPVGTA